MSEPGKTTGVDDARTESGIAANNKLRPCPFCGSDGFIEVLGGVKSEYRIVHCSRCKCDLHFYPSEQLAVQAWNNQPRIADLEAQLSELESQLRTHQDLLKNSHNNWLTEKDRANRAEAQLSEQRTTIERLGREKLRLQETNRKVEEDWQSGFDDATANQADTIRKLQARTAQNAENPEDCAACSHPGKDHDDEFGNCASCGCMEYIDSTQMIAQLKEQISEVSVLSRQLGNADRDFEVTELQATMERLGGQCDGLMERNQQLEQDRLKLEGELRHEREGHGTNWFPESFVIQLQAQVAELQTIISQLRNALEKVDGLAQAGLDGNGERVYDSHNELKIVEACQTCPGVETSGRRFFTPATITPKQEEGQPKEDKTV